MSSVSPSDIIVVLALFSIVIVFMLAFRVLFWIYLFRYLFKGLKKWSTINKRPLK